MEKDQYEVRFSANAQVDIRVVRDEKHMENYKKKIQKLKQEAHKLGIELWVDELPIID